MLLVLLGPSGVGKSTVMRVLESSGQVVMLECDTTRPIREGESNKRQVSHEEHEEATSRGDYIFVSEIYGNRYGLRADAARRAAGAAGVYAIDLPEQAIDALGQLPSDGLVAVALLYDSNDQALGRLADCGRLDRASEVLAQAASYKNLFSARATLPTWVDPQPIYCDDSTPDSVAGLVMARVASRMHSEVA